MDGRGLLAGAGSRGNVPARVPGGSGAPVAVAVGSVNAVVVSALVLVSGGMRGAGLSPGAWIVPVTAPPAPSWTVSYCC